MLPLLDKLGFPSDAESRRVPGAAVKNTAEARKLEYGCPQSQRLEKLVIVPGLYSNFLESAVMGCLLCRFSN